MVLVNRLKGLSGTMTVRLSWRYDAVAFKDCACRSVGPFVDVEQVHCFGWLDGIVPRLDTCVVALRSDIQGMELLRKLSLCCCIGSYISEGLVAFGLGLAWFQGG